MALKIDAKLEGKLTCDFQNNEFGQFNRLKNSNFI